MKGEKSIKFIVDASFVLAFLLPDEKQDKVIEIFDQFTRKNIELYSINLLPYEVINGLKSAIIRERIPLEKAVNLINEFLALTIPYEDTDLTKAIEISVKHKLSVYDSSYLYLKEKLGFKLLTLDEKLQKMEYTSRLKSLANKI